MSKKKKREHQIKLITRLLIAVGTFLAVSILIFIVTKRNIYGSIILMCASLYMLVDVVPKLWRCKEDAKGRTQ